MRKSAEYYRLDAFQKRMYRAGIPSQYIKLQTPGFSHFEGYRDLQAFDNKYSIPIATQEKWCEFLQDAKSYKENFLIGVGSEPTEYQAIAIGVTIAKAALKQKNQTVLFWDLGDPIPERIPDIFIVYNVSIKTQEDFLQKLRIALYRFKESFRMVLVGGTDPLTFFDTKLHMTCDAVLYSNKRVPVRTLKR